MPQQYRNNNSISCVILVVYLLLHRDVLGDLPEALALATRLRAAAGVGSASLGRRLRGHAFAPDLAVYLAKEDASQGCFRLVVRLALDVQEVVVQCGLGRDEFKKTLAATVAAMTDDA